MNEVEYKLWERLRAYNKRVNVAKACRLMGLGATLSPQSTIRHMLNHLVDEGWVRESIADHQIVYKAIDRKEEDNDIQE